MVGDIVAVSVSVGRQFCNVLRFAIYDNFQFVRSVSVFKRIQERHGHEDT